MEHRLTSRRENQYATHTFRIEGNGVRCGTLFESISIQRRNTRVTIDEEDHGIPSGPVCFRKNHELLHLIRSLRIDILQVSKLP